MEIVHPKELQPYIKPQIAPSVCNEQKIPFFPSGAWFTGLKPQKNTPVHFFFKNNKDALLFIIV